MKAWDEFKFWPDTTTNSRVICPCASKKLMYNVVNTLAPLFLIGSSSYWQVTRTSITSRTSSKFGQIRPRTAELAAFECLEKSPLTNTPQPLYNTVRYNTVLDITRISVGPQLVILDLFSYITRQFTLVITRF